MEPSLGSSENAYRWTAADPNLRWFHQNALGMDVRIEDISEQVAALALQGPTSAGLLKSLVDGADIGRLGYFHVTQATIAGVARRHFTHGLHGRSRL